MKCNHCGQESLREESNCPNCDESLGEKYHFNEIDFVFDDTIDFTTMEEAQVEEPKLEQTMKHQHRRIKLMIGAITLLFGIFVVIFIVIKQSYQDREYPYVPLSQKNITPLGFKVDGVQNIVLLRLDGKAVETIESDQIYTQSNSMSREVVALTTGFDHRLYVATEKEVILLDYNVESVQVSQDGTRVAYIKDVTKDIGELQLYDVNTKMSTNIALDVSKDSFVLSPDGDSIAYVRVQEGGLKKELYVSIDGKEPKQIDFGQTPVGISNHGTYLYVIGEKGFNLIMNSDMIKLGDEVTTAYGGIYNRDLSQVIYSDRGSTYLSEEGKITKIAEGIIYNLVLPPDAGYDRNHTGTTSLTNHIIQKQDGLYYLDDQYQLNFICESIGTWQVAKNQESLLLFKSNELYLLTGLNNKNVTKKKINDASNITYFQANPDLSLIYYMNDKGELLSAKGDEKPIKITDNETSEICYNFNDGFWYYATDNDDNVEGNLYYSANQEPGRVVKNLESGIMAGMARGILAGRFKGDNYMDLYSLNHGEAKLILSEVSNY